LNSKSDVKPDGESVIIKKEVIATTEEYHGDGCLSKQYEAYAALRAFAEA